MNPYLIQGPALIQFSGGRTSAYMLYHIIKAYGGCLPSDIRVLFQNTGKEREETLVFINECSIRWNTPITWLEFVKPTYADGSPVSPLRHDLMFKEITDDAGPLFDGLGFKAKRVVKSRGERKKYVRKYRVIDFVAARRNGEPFDDMIEWKGLLPTQAAKFCTQYLKIETAWAYARQELGLTEWDSIVGIRYDEPKRWAGRGLNDKNKRETRLMPLVDAKVTLSDVMSFWKAQPFDLQLEQHEGNCDLCPWKKPSKRIRIMRAHPEYASWWIDKEKMLGPMGTPLRFKLNDPSFAQLAKVAADQVFDPDLYGDEEADEIPCGCVG